ncbi:hypothetical protein PHMEG_0005491 [Phytophthora megakarya]|uniref:Uncharacterized protein n=1 Tax=Phytophthora megakarya TaxID=4795 RepID=A0A225WR23_9STRA|nr:hypothetical protein PHMEG_0005491 [Phytophthora megakarya]
MTQTRKMTESLCWTTMSFLVQLNLAEDASTGPDFNEWSEPPNEESLPYTHESYEDRPADWMARDYPNIYQGNHGCTDDALVAALTPSKAFFRFAPPHMWGAIAGASDDYFYVKLDERVTAQHPSSKPVTRNIPIFKYRRQSRKRSSYNLLWAFLVAGCVFLLRVRLCQNERSLNITDAPRAEELFLVVTSTST